MITARNTESRKTMKNAIIRGAKTSNQLLLPVIAFITKRTALNSNPNEIKICLTPPRLTLILLVFLLATLSYLISRNIISTRRFLFLPALVLFDAIGFSIPFPYATTLLPLMLFETKYFLKVSALVCDII